MYQYEKLPAKLVTVGHVDDRGNYFVTVELVENPRRTKKWVTPDYYLHVQEITEMKRDAAQVQKSTGKYKHCGDKFFKDLPFIEEMLGDCWWDDGKPRTPCHLKVEIVGLMVHIALIDTENRRSCHTAAPGLLDALGLLEAHCATGTPPWRSWGPERGRRN